MHAGTHCIFFSFWETKGCLVLLAILPWLKSGDLMSYWAEFIGILEGPSSRGRYREHLSL